MGDGEAPGEPGEGPACSTSANGEREEARAGRVTSVEQAQGEGVVTLAAPPPDLHQQVASPWERESPRLPKAVRSLQS